MTSLVPNFNIKRNVISMFLNKKYRYNGDLSSRHCYLIMLMKVEVRYNLPSTSGEECKFSITTSVREIRDKNVQDLFGPLQKDVVDMEEEKRKKEEEDKKGKGKKKCKGTKNNKKCKRKKKKKTKPPKKPQKVQPVKSIHLKVCTR